MTYVDQFERRVERKGERRGERKGRARMLLQQIAARFGSVPPQVSARIEAAGGTALDRWALRVLTATTPEEVVAAGDEARATAKPSRRQPATRSRSGQQTATRRRA